MQNNLEQLRALHAHRFWDENWQWPGLETAQKRLKDVRGAEGGDVVSKLGPLILECGLLSTLALAKHKRGGHEALLKEVGRYLGSQDADGRCLLPEKAETLVSFITQLTQNDSSLLRQATAEALVYVGYLKRFAPPKDKPQPRPAQFPNPVPVEAPHAD